MKSKVIVCVVAIAVAIGGINMKMANDKKEQVRIEQQRLAEETRLAKERVAERERISELAKENNTTIPRYQMFEGDVNSRGLTFEQWDEMKKVQQAKAERLNKERLERIEKQTRGWLNSNYVDEFGDRTNKKYQKKALNNASFTNSATRNNDDITIEAFQDKESISFRIYTYNRGDNKRHIGGYTLQARGKDGKTVSYKQSYTGTTYISKKHNRIAYDQFNNLFKNSEEVRIVVRGTNSDSYNGVLDTKFYEEVK